MAKLTLLKIVNNTLMALEATQVGSISDTLESTSVARIAEETFYEMITQGDWPHLNELTLMDSLGDSDRPNYLVIPDKVKEIKYIQYNGNNLRKVELEEFLKLSKSRDLLSDNVVQVQDFSGFDFNILNNSDPECYTILNDKYLVCDSFNILEGATLQSSKSVAETTYIPDWTEDDSFVPDLTDNMFPTYLALVKRAAFLYLRREQSPKDERMALSGMGRLYRQESKLNLKSGIKNYGR